MEEIGLKGLSILYVEDEEEIRELLKEVLQDEFLYFDVAQDGVEALEKFKQKEYDLVITDIEMPKLNGLDLTKHIKEISPATPVILLTAYSQKERLFKAIDVGVNKYLIKPFTPEKLLEVIYEVFKKNNKKVVKRVKLNDNMFYDFATKEIINENENIRLTKKESMLLEFLIANKNRVITAKEIKEHLWQKDFSENALRALIKRVRKKSSKELIANIPSIGYKINIEN
jgi:DNA-binding response OmpR family regulator